MNTVLKTVILGAPGSGKGTISSRIIKAFNMDYISSGDRLRQHIKEKTRKYLPILNGQLFLFTVQIFNQVQARSQAIYN